VRDDVDGFEPLSSLNCARHLPRRGFIGSGDQICSETILKAYVDSSQAVASGQQLSRTEIIQSLAGGYGSAARRRFLFSPAKSPRESRAATLAALTKKGSAVGRSLAEVSGGAMIVAIRHPDGRFETQPPAETVLTVGDMIIAMGPPATVERLDRLFQPPRGFSSIRGAISGL